MNNFFIILAAGESKRFKSNVPKPYVIYKGKQVIQHSIDKVKNSKKIKKIIIVINKKHKKFVKNLNTKNLKIIYGGKTRAESSYKALQSIKNDTQLYKPGYPVSAHPLPQLTIPTCKNVSPSAANTTIGPPLSP